MKADILILGAGLTGCSLARELSQYKANVTVIDSRPFIPPGLPLSFPGILLEEKKPFGSPQERTFSWEGYKFLIKILATMNLPVFWTKGHFLSLHSTPPEREKASLENFPFSIPPSSFLWEEKTALIDSAILTLAMAENGLENGVKFILGEDVTGLVMEKESLTKVLSSSGEHSPDLLVNTSTKKGWELEARMGLSYTIPSVYQEIFFSLSPDKLPGLSYLSYGADSPDEKIELAFSPVYQQFFLKGTPYKSLPSGPFYSHESELSKFCESLKKILPGFDNSWILNYWAFPFGKYEEALQVGPSPLKGYFRGMGGQRNPAISLGIAREVASQIVSTLGLVPKRKFTPQWSQKNLNERTWEALGKEIQRDPRYGNLLCACQKLTEGELVGLCQKPLLGGYLEPLISITGASQGICQSQTCLGEIAKTFSYYLDKPMAEIEMDGPKGYLFRPLQ